MSHTVYPSLRNKRVVVTGGGSSIGAAIVESFARQGAHVAFIDIADSDSRELERRLADERLPAALLRCDLTDIDAIRMVFPRIREDIGGHRRSRQQRRERRPPQPRRNNARVLGRAHRGQSASLFLLRAGGRRRYEGSARRARSSIWARCPGISRCRIWPSIRPPRRASKGMTRGLARDLGALWRAGELRRAGRRAHAATDEAVAHAR